MTAFAVHASKNGKTVQPVRISPTMSVAKDRALLNEGWQVHITDSQGSRFAPADLIRCWPLIGILPFRIRSSVKAGASGRVPPRQSKL
jgi:hypothetical protein